MTTGTGTLPAEGVRTMFDRIAPVYDAMNHVMTAGLDRRWRRVAAEAVVRPGDRVLDACCGTGDFALADARAGGRVGVLEITRPRGLLAPFYRVWFDGIVPLLGKVLPGGAAYSYLPASVRRFPGPEDLARVMRDAGFEDVRYRLFAGGIVALHTGVAR